MPARKLELAPDDPLFTEEDPFLLDYPGPDGKVRQFRLLDRANWPFSDPGDHTVTWVAEALIVQVVEEERDDFRKMLVSDIETNRVALESLGEIIKWIRETREAAEQGTLARSVGRPNTKARRPSSAS
jgi:hypothetical protein